jgi:hypothetical protein
MFRVVEDGSHPMVLDVFTVLGWPWPSGVGDRTKQGISCTADRAALCCRLKDTYEVVEDNVSRAAATADSRFDVSSKAQKAARE